MRIEIDFEMDAEGVRAHGRRLIGRAARAGDVVFDFGGVTRLDSSGIGLLVHLHKRKLEAKRRFAVDNVDGQPLALLAQLNLLAVWARKDQPSRSAVVRETRPVLNN